MHRTLNRSSNDRMVNMAPMGTPKSFQFHDKSELVKHVVLIVFAYVRLDRFLALSCAIKKVELCRLHTSLPALHWLAAWWLMLATLARFRALGQIGEAAGSRAQAQG